MVVEPLDKTEKVLAYLLTSNSAVPMAMEPSISMTTSEGESEAATPSAPAPTRKHAAARFRKAESPYKSADEAGRVVLTSCQRTIAIRGAHRHHQPQSRRCAATGA